MNIWQELALTPTRDVRAIKVAYARRLKQTHPEDDPEGFQRLRSAYDRALKLAAMAESADDGDEDADSEEDAWAGESEPSALGSPLERQDLEYATPARDPDLPAPQDEASAAKSAHQIAWEAATELCESLIALPLEQRSAALRERLHQPGWELLDFRARLEPALIARLHQNSDSLLPLIDVLSPVFGWEQGHGPGDYSGQLLQDLSARNAARKWRRTIETSRDAVQIDALALLVNPVDERRFRRYARSEGNLKVLREMLATLHTVKLEVLHFEANPESVKWWLARLNSQTTPSSDSNVLKLLLWVAGPPLLMLIALINLGPLISFAPTAESDVFKGLIVASYGFAFLIFKLYRLTADWIEDGALPGLRAELRRWRSEPKARGVAIGITAICVLASAGADASVAFWPVALLVIIQLVYWIGATQATWLLLLYSWPLHLILTVPVSAAYFQLPAALRWMEKAPGLVFPHLLACFAFLPLAQAYIWTKSKLSLSTSAEPHRATFVVTLIGFVVLSVAFVGMTTGFDGVRSPDSKAIERARAVTEAGRRVVASALERTVSAPTPGLPHDRALGEINQIAATKKAAFNKIFGVWLAAHPKATSRYVAIEFRVGSNGLIVSSKLLTSEYRDPALEALLLAEVNSFRFSNDPLLRPSTFTVSFGKEPEIPGQGLRGSPLKRSRPTSS